MENQCTEQEFGTLETGFFEISGEPAIVINGVPDVSSNDGSLVQCEVVSDAASNLETVFGKWMEGREVRKLFGEQYYCGTVTKFDKEAGWYRVVYEDGDFEDLEWHELEQVLVPLDISISLKSLAMKIIRKNQRLIQKPGKEGPQCVNRGVRKAVCVRKTVQLPEEASPPKFNGNHIENVPPMAQESLIMKESNSEPHMMTL